MLNGWDNDTWFFVNSMFNTSLGLMNFSKNTEQKEHQEELENKLDIILSKLEAIERRLNIDETNGV